MPVGFYKLSISLLQLLTYLYVYGTIFIEMHVNCAPSKKKFNGTDG